MEDKYQDLGLKKDYLYEILATTFSYQKNETKPHTSCMGIRIKNDNEISIKPYPNTITYRNIKNTSFISINFVEDISLYAFAALKGLHLSEQYKNFPIEYYNYYNFKDEKKRKIKIPYIKQAWAIIICNVKNEGHFTKEDIFGKVNLTMFSLNILSIIKFKESFKIFNRAENLALEALILTTRLKIAYERNDHTLILEIQKSITEIVENIRRFSKNPDANRTVKIIEAYIQDLKLTY